MSANVTRIRIAAGQSIPDVAAGTRIAENVLNGLEFGRVVKDHQVVALARHFGVTVEELTG